MASYILDEQKYKASMLYFLRKLGSIAGKKKAYKLFYFLDFDFFEAYGRPLTGETYTKLPMGPAPKYFDGITEELAEEGYISITKERRSPSHDNDTIVYAALKKSFDYKLSTDEKKMLDRVVRLYGGFTGKQLEDLSHTQAPYLAVSLGNVMPYEFSYYRDSADLKE